MYATRRAVFALFAVALLAVALLALAVIERVEYRNRVAPGVKVAGLDVSGESERAAYAKIGQLSSELEHAPIRAVAGKVRLSADPRNLAYDVDELATLQAARAAGRDGGPVAQVAGSVLRRLRADEIPLVVTYDPDALEGVLDGWEQELNDGVVQGDLRFEGTKVVAVLPKAGTGIQRDRARALLEARLHNHDRSPIELPVGTVDADVSAEEVQAAAARARRVLDGSYTIDLGSKSVPFTPAQLATALSTRTVGHQLELVVSGPKLRAAIGPALTSLEQPPVDAGFSVVSASQVDVVPSQNGMLVDMAAVGRAVLRGEHTIEARLESVKPKHDTEWARGLGITKMVSSFTTYYPSGQARVENIHRGADLLTNTIVEPGKSFSLNETIGPRTPERGFVQAPVFYGEFTEDFGGGVSQLATTLYNAIWFGGYEDLEHKPHTIYITRYPMGRESTVNYGTVDVRFRNDTKHGVLIRASYGEDSVTVSFFGDNEGRAVHEEDRKILGETAVTDQLINCPASPEVDKENACAHLSAFETELLEEGHTGYEVEFYRVIEQPGHDTVRQRYHWRYRMTQNRVLVGTKAPPKSTSTSKPGPKSSTTPSSKPGSTSTTKPKKAAPSLPAGGSTTTKP